MHRLRLIVTTQKNPPVHGPRKVRLAPRRTPSNTDSLRAIPSSPARTQPSSTGSSRLSKPTSNPPTRSNSNSSARSPTRSGVCAASRAWRPASSPLPSTKPRRYMEKRRPDELRPGYDGETLLLGSAMLDRTQAFVHLARYDGHLSRRFFRAVKQLSDLRRDESRAREARSSAGSYTPTDPDAYRGRYVPAQAPPPIDPPSPTAGRIGFRASRESAPQAGLPDGQAPAQRASFTQTTKQTQSRRTPVESTPSKDEPRSADLAVEIRGLCSAPRWEPTFPLRERVRFFCGARSQRAASRLISTPGAVPTTNNQTNPIAPNSSGIKRRLPIDQRQSRAGATCRARTSRASTVSWHPPQRTGSVDRQKQTRLNNHRCMR